MGEGEKYNFYVHSDIKKKVVIINITPSIHLFDYAFDCHLLFAKKVHLSTVKYKSVKIS